MKKSQNQELEEKYHRYEANLRRAFSQIFSTPMNMSDETRQIVDLALRYQEDGKYFKEKHELTTALIALSYVEGLLDALRLLNIIHFAWERNSTP